MDFTAQFVESSYLTQVGIFGNRADDQQNTGYDQGKPLRTFTRLCPGYSLGSEYVE